MIFPEGIKVYGDTNHRDKNCHSEDAELSTFVNQVKKLYPDIGRIMVHIPNEGKRKGYEVDNLKRKGALTSGASDIIIPGNPSFIMEMKKIDHTLCRWQPGQIAYLKSSKEMGCFVCVCLGWEAAMMAFNDWKAKHYPRQPEKSHPIDIESF